MSDDWLDQIRQLYQADKAKRLAEAKKQKQAESKEQRRKNQAIALLRHSRAHELLRQVQRALLDGEGTLTVYDNTKKYDRAIVLAWQGPISEARRPDPKDPDDYAYILVGVRDGKLWVNNTRLDAHTPETLQMALVEACKNPAIQERADTNE